MASSIRILSTRKLAEPQRERLLSAGFALVEIPMIKTREVPFDAPQNIEKAIITSQNAVNAITGKSVTIAKCFCVGQKTASALKAIGVIPELIAETGAELARKLVKHYPGATFHYLGTRSRRDELPQILKENNTLLKEIEVYETITDPQMVPGTFDGILFFSPSAVEAYAKENSFAGPVCFSIGPTTAQTLKKYTDKVITARESTTEHLILATIKHFKSINAHNRETSI